MAKTVTFRGGIHPPCTKNTSDLAIEEMPAPANLAILLSQHIGAPCEALVKMKDEVKVGQKIGDADSFVSAPVHSSVSGTVTGIKPCPHPLGMTVQAVLIESDGQNTVDDSIRPRENVDSLSSSEIIDIAREAGLVGMGGATFPTHVKLSPPKEKIIDAVILNGAECEPYLTADHRVMLEKPADVVAGLDLIMRAVGVKKGFVGIETNKPDAIEALGEAVTDSGLSDIEVIGLQTKYPQGAEKNLIDAILGREVPSGTLPFEVGVLVQNVGTACAMHDAVVKKMPPIERVLTVTGRVKEPKNLKVRVGTPLRDVIDFCGGPEGPLYKVVMGGPMMGIAQYSLDVPVTKGTSGILVLSKEDSPYIEEEPCIRCGRCLNACPMHLMPCNITDAVAAEDWDDADKYGALDCVECGSCAYVCPASRPIVQYAKLAKSVIMARRKKK